MRNTLKNICLALVGLVTVGCIGNYEYLNTNPYEVTEDQIAADDYLIQGTLKTMQGFVVPVQEHQFQFMNILCSSTLGGYLAEYKGWDTKISTYNPNNEWASFSFNNVIPGIYSAYQQLLNSTEDEIALSVADIVKVATFSQLTDIYGPIPYSKIGAGDALTAAYDSQEDIYDTMFAELTEAVNVLTERIESVLNPNADMVFGGDLRKWVKFANSLKLRMAVRIVYADAGKAQAMAEEAVNHQIGVMTSNDENPSFIHPTQNLYYLCCRQWGDYRAAADIVCYMNGLEDPRRAAYFTSSEYENGYSGWRRGTLSSYSNGGEKCSNIKVESNTPMIWMNAAECAFLMAEGALRGWNMGSSASALYKEGVELSFKQWGLQGAEEYLKGTSMAPVDYTDPSGQAVSYSSVFGGGKINSAWSDSDSFETSLEKIITQKWIANWRATGVEGWAEFRRTGYPRLLAAGANLSGGTIADGTYARRLPYPLEEKTSNSENYNEALSTLLKGPDNMATRLWWDCNPNTMNN